MLRHMLAIQTTLLDMKFALLNDFYIKHQQDCHKPTFNKGVVVKINANQRYATSAVTHSVLKVIAESAGVPLQVFLLS